jgi:transglutaminase-like putative cysteine protease
MRITFVALLILICLSKLALSQDFPYGSISDDEMNMKSYAKDTSAHAVVLQEYGQARIAVGNDDNIKVYLEYHIKIKIFDSKGFDKGTVKIPVYNNSSGDVYETVNDIKGVTYYKDDNGGTQKIELEDKKIYPVKESKHLAHYNFALPGLRNGCVIEYKYELESPYWEEFPVWHFQDDIPKVYSEFEVHIPAFWVYNASLKGFLKLTKNTASVESKCFVSGGASCDCSLLVFGISDIPAFIEEDYMTSPNNFKSAINFDLQEFTNPYTGAKNKYAKEWQDIDYQLKNDDNFGGQLKKKGLFKERVVPVIAGKTTDLDKAKAVYVYIQKQFKWNEYYGIYSADGLSKALNDHSGSVADINLSLVNALNAAGLNAETVLLSVRENGKINPLYPGIGDFDYVVAKVNIGDQNYLLDATDPLLPFGIIPMRCLNDKGRVFGLDKPSYWFDLSNLPQKEKSTFALDATLQDDGKIKGTLVNYSTGYDAYSKRKEIKKFNSIDEYVDDLAGKFPKLKILKSEITNMDSLDMPLIEKYEVEIKLYDKVANSNLTFNPFFMNWITTNPFKLPSRSYPVDWGMPSDDRFVLTMHLPAQYTIEAPPQDISIGLPNDGGRFLTSYISDNNTFTFSNVIQFTKSIYTSGEYPALKELYNRIIQAEKAEIVFKKK